MIKQFIRDQRVDLVCLQETKVQTMNTQMARSLGAGRFSEWVSVDASGSAGGILLMWDKRILEVSETVCGSFTVSCSFRNVEDGFHWIFTGVYGPVLTNLKEEMWEELGSVRGLWPGPWCIGGDFNASISPTESNRGGRFTQAMRRFAFVLDDLGVRDLPLQGGPFTWSGGTNGQTMSRIDRFLVSGDWESYFNRITQSTLPRPVSDHFPILLDSGGIRSGPSPFRFENMWLKTEGFKDLLKGWWQGLSVRGSASFILAEKLKGLKGKLKIWNKEVFGNVSTKRTEALFRVGCWDNVEKERELSLEESEERAKAKDDYRRWSLLEEASWRQKSREIWLKEGDRNTGFFHKMANSHRRRNAINKIKINGRWLTDDNAIQKGIVDEFKGHLSEPGLWRPAFPSISLKELGTDDADSLEVRFSEEEVSTAIAGLNGEKAPGPDGFPIAFWSFSWEFVKDEVMEFFKEFYERKKFVKSLNATFLVLIPKKGNIEDVKDYRPISLLGSLYKILAKVLANRLRRVLVKVISPSQNAFVEGRQILDAALIANEVVDSMLRRNDGGVVCKLDIEKAYDHINWEYVLEVMRRMGFGQRWIAWIFWCMSTVSYSILINGVSEGFFRSTRGIRQGDPLSPYLFVLGMDILSRLVNKAVEGNFLSGCKLGGAREEEELEVSHLLYADDTLLFCKDNPDQLACLRWILMWFEALSGLKINLNKSEIFPIGGRENIEVLTAELGCRAGSLPTTYLGLPLGASHKSVRMWDTIEERFRRRLASWKRQYISKGGRVTLIKSTLSNLPIYFMSLFRIPSLVCKRLEKIQRDFLWGGGNLEKKPHLVSWVKVCTDKKVGGLGVRSLNNLNKALLGKWLWRFANERDSFWRRTIRSKFGESQGGWCSGEVRNSFGTGLWKEIRKGWDMVRLNAKFVVGNGSRISFWKDVWGGGGGFVHNVPNVV